MIRYINKDSLDFKNYIISDISSVRDALIKLNLTKKTLFVYSNDSKKIIGAITDGDIRRGFLKKARPDSNVKELMNLSPITSKEMDNDSDYLKLMSENKVNSLAVTDTSGRLLLITLMSFNESELTSEKVAVLMAGGIGSRLSPLTDNCPKPMLKVSGTPLLESLIKRLKKYGYSKIYISVNYLSEKIIDYFQDGEKLNIKIEYISEDKPLGTAGSLHLLKGKINNPFLVMNGDVISEIDFKNFLNFHFSRNSKATMAVKLHEMQSDYGVVETKGLNIIGFKEKPIYSNYINTGIYILNPESLKLLNGQKIDMPELFDLLKNNNLETLVYPMYEAWKDIGNIDQFKSLTDE